MALVTKSIGSSGRDYSTITLWEAALGGAAGGSGNDALGECYDDSAFDETITINDTTPDSVTLSVASGERHDGTDGNGARIVRTAAPTTLITIGANSLVPFVFEWLEIDCNGNNIRKTIDTVAGMNGTISKILLHGVSAGRAFMYAIGVLGGDSGDTINVLNCIVYDIYNANNGEVDGIYSTASTGGRNRNFLNCTVHDVYDDHATGTARGINFADGGSITVKNMVITDTSANTSTDYIPASPSNATAGYNLSSDTSASDDGVTGNVLTSKTSANQFVSNSDPYDLHIKTGADAIDAGEDLGTTPSGVEIDIDARDRDAQGDTWDMGAHEFVTAAAAYSPEIIMII
jgi:hypothetical protein